MFLKSLDLYGFKSFADKTHIDFSDGITSLLGPNGCGKSNIVDAVKWVLGEQSMKTIRAGKKEDVIFNGTDTRKPMNFAEVTLVIDNSEHKLPTDVEEIEIKRRVFRSGDSEYYLNKNRCLLRNIQELFFDTGVGKSAYSILEQGKIDQILSKEPEKRRYVFEEAAGISRFKSQCNDAANKIARTEENINVVSINAKDAERNCNRMRTQAEKAKRAKSLSSHIMELDIQFHISQLRSYQSANDERLKLIAEGSALLESYKKGGEELDQKIAEFQEEMRIEDERFHDLQLEINTMEGRLNNSNSAISMLNDSLTEAGMRVKDQEARSVSLRENLEREKASLEEYIEALSDKKDQTEESERHLERLRGMLNESNSKVEALENDVASMEERNTELDNQLLQLSVELKEVIESLIAEVDEKTGAEYSKDRTDKARTSFRKKGEEAKALIDERISFFTDLKDGVPISREVILMDFRMVDEALSQLISLFEEFSLSIPPVVDTLLSPEGLIGKKREIESKENEIRAEMIKNRYLIVSGREEIKRLREDIERLRETIDTANASYIELKASLDSAQAVIDARRRSIEDMASNFDECIYQAESYRRRMESIQDDIRAEEEARLLLSEELTQKKEEAKNAGSHKGERGAELMRMREERTKLSMQYTETDRNIAMLRGQIESSDSFTDNVMTSFFNKYTRSLGEYIKEYEDKAIPDSSIIQNEIKEAQRELDSLGNINWMAEQEYEENEAQFKFYSKHLDDLMKAKNDLEEVYKEIRSRSEKLFTKTYKEISANFQAMFRRLFGGGRAEITLEDPENVLESGIDIIAQPPGKKPQSLDLLSGGERAMTAVALLFATYQVKPSPFCILDELDAPLDDRNIGYFIDVLQDFAKDSQFIIITHNQHTVTGSRTLLGVTQIEWGVSTTVTYKLGNIKGQPVIMDENEKVVTFNDDGTQK